MFRNAPRLGLHPHSLSTSITTEAVVCKTCTTLPIQGTASSASVSCTCQSLKVYNPGIQSNFKSHEYLDIEDWEFAGDEERDDDDNNLQSALHLGMITAATTSTPVHTPFSPTSLDAHNITTFASSTTEDGGEEYQQEIGLATESDWVEPPSLQGAPSQETVHTAGGESIMLEAFHQFQQNPQVQNMVVALATDQGVWGAVLANEKLQEYRRRLEGDFEAGAVHKAAEVDIRFLSRVIWTTQKAVKELRKRLRERISGMIKIADKRLSREAREMLFHTVLRSCLILAMVILALVTFLSVLPLQASEGILPT